MILRLSSAAVLLDFQEIGIRFLIFVLDPLRDPRSLSDILLGYGIWNGSIHEREQPETTKPF